MKTNQCALSQGYRGRARARGEGGLISTVAARQTEPGSTNLASTVSVHMRLFGFFFLHSHEGTVLPRSLSAPPPLPPSFPPPSHPPAIPPSHPAMPAAAACKCILHARRRSQRLFRRPPAASSSLATSVFPYSLASSSGVLPHCDSTRTRSPKKRAHVHMDTCASCC